VIDTYNINFQFQMKKTLIDSPKAQCVQEKEKKKLVGELS
jgi:hypothetical protein